MSMDVLSFVNDIVNDLKLCTICYLVPILVTCNVI